MKKITITDSISVNYNPDNKNFKKLLSFHKKRWVLGITNEESLIQAIFLNYLFRKNHMNKITFKDLEFNVTEDKNYSEKDMDNAYDKGFEDGCKKQSKKPTQ